MTSQNGRLRLKKDTASTIKMPMEVRVGSYRFNKINIPYALGIALFGEEGRESFRFHDYEVVRRTATLLYVHIFSFKRAQEIFQLDGQMIASFICVRKRIHHKACGKAFFEQVGTGRSAVGYIMNCHHEDEDEGQIEVYIPVIKKSLQYPRPVWDDVTGCYLHEGFVQDGYRMVGLEPICLRYNEQASSLWLLYHKVGFRVDDDESMAMSYTT